jgi:type I restriction enzyme, S subunit
MMNPDRLLKHFEQISEAPDAVPRLRQFILNLAVWGKLVEQNPEEMPASVLVGQIKEQRESLAALGKIKRSEPFKPVGKDELLFDLCHGWSAARMGFLTIKLGAGSTPLGGKSIYQSEGIPFLRSQNVHDDGLKLHDVAFIPKSIHARMAGTHIEENDLLLNITGASIGRCALLPIGFGEGNVSQHVAIIRLVQPEIREFVHLSLISPVYQKMIMNVQVGVSREGLSMQRLKFFPMVIPPIAEQGRIVAKVDELMALCGELETARTKREKRRDRLVAATLSKLTEENGENIERKSDQNFSAAPFFINHIAHITTRPEHIHQLRQAILNLAVRGKLVPQEPKDESIDSLISQIQEKRKLKAGKGELLNVVTSIDSVEGVFSIPKSWKWVRLGFVMNVIMGQSPPGETYNTFGDGIPLINGPVEFTDGPFGTTVLNQYTTAPNKLCNKGDFLLCVRGSTTGRSNVAGFDACIGRGVAALQALFDDQFIRFFIWSWRDQIIEMGRGIAFPSINRRQIEDLPTPLPPLSEQHRIVAKVNELMALCDDLEARLNTTANTRHQFLEATLNEALYEKHEFPQGAFR